jgi:UDP-N-acetylmuramoylalanine-D-glutamate ligase
LTKLLKAIHAVFEDEHGILWVDDSKATNVEATYVGLKGLKERHSVVLLGGIAKVKITTRFQ